RRNELWRRVRRPDWRGELRTGATAFALIGAVVLLVTQPWRPEPERVQDDTWLSVSQAIPDVTVPKDLQGWQIQGGAITQGTRRILLSLFGTFNRSQDFYDGVIKRIPDIAPELRKPGDGETLAVLVSDRHDNIGMDEVVRSVAEEA